MPLPEAGSGSIAIMGEPYQFGKPITLHAQWSERLKNPRLVIDAFVDGEQVYGRVYGREDDRVVLTSQALTLAGINLGEGYSIWQQADGGPATCHARLFYFKTGNHEWNGSGQQEYVQLAEVEFQAE